MEYVMDNACLKMRGNYDSIIRTVVNSGVTYLKSKNVSHIPSNQMQDKVVEILSILHSPDEYIFTNPIAFWPKWTGVGNLTSRIGDAWKPYVTNVENIFAGISPGFTLQEMFKYLTTLLDIQIKNYLVDPEMYNMSSLKRTRIVEKPYSDIETIAGEMVGGLLYTARASTVFWEQKVGELNLTDKDIVSGIIQADAFGYIIGWGASLWDDAHSAGGVQPSGQGKRIGAGILGAIGASGGLGFGPIVAQANNGWPATQVGNTTPVDADVYLEAYFTL